MTALYTCLGCGHKFLGEAGPNECPKCTHLALGEPQKLTAHNACASTYGLRGEEYHPCIQT